MKGGWGKGDASLPRVKGQAYLSDGRGFDSEVGESSLDGERGEESDGNESGVHRLGDVQGSGAGSSGGLRGEGARRAGGDEDGGGRETRCEEKGRGRRHEGFRVCPVTRQPARHKHAQTSHHGTR